MRNLYPARAIQRPKDPFLTTVEKVILKNFPRARLFSSARSPDLEHSISGKYARVLFQTGNHLWAAMAASPAEPGETLHHLLAFSLIWRDYLVRHTCWNPSRLLLMIPRGERTVLLSRLSWIRGVNQNLLLAEMDGEHRSLEFLDASDTGNIDTCLTRIFPFFPLESCREDEGFRRVMALAPAHIEPLPGPDRKSMVFRIHGLEFARLRLGSPVRLTFGIGPAKEKFTSHSAASLEQLVREIQHYRQPAAPTPAHPYYHLQAERWLESLLLKDIRQLDPCLDPEHVYPQVPMYLGRDRGILDILTATRDGRLAVIELKVSEDIQLPFQGLDYWLRVCWHQQREDLASNGYFRGLELRQAPPLLYFVCPQFCYHSTFPVLTSQFNPSVPFQQIGLNENWREGVQVVLRRDLSKPFHSPR
jgi:hypothetical protein